MSTKHTVVSRFTGILWTSATSRCSRVRFEDLPIKAGANVEIYWFYARAKGEWHAIPEATVCANVDERQGIDVVVVFGKPSEASLALKNASHIRLSKEHVANVRRLPHLMYTIVANDAPYHCIKGTFEVTLDFNEAVAVDLLAQNTRVRRSINAYNRWRQLFSSTGVDLPLVTLDKVINDYGDVIAWRRLHALAELVGRFPALAQVFRNDKLCFGNMPSWRGAIDGRLFILPTYCGSYILEMAHYVTRKGRSHLKQISLVTIERLVECDGSMLHVFNELLPSETPCREFFDVQHEKGVNQSWWTFTC